MSAQHRRTRRRAELSQHFLRKGATAAKLVQSTSISSRDFVIEIGPGRGALTRQLVGRTQRLVAVELDPGFCDGLRREFGSLAEIVHSDFLAYPLPDRPHKVIGNLPFARTSEIVRKLVETSTPPEDAWLVMQREAAHRFAGSPYAAETLWSIRLKPWWHVEIVWRLRKTDFDPPPSVDCVVLWLSRRARPLIRAREGSLYHQLTERAFRTGPTVRKAIGPWLTPTQIRRLAYDLRFKPDARPSALHFEQWLGIFRFVALEGQPGTTQGDLR